jgi:hypothetical protein
VVSGSRQKQHRSSQNHISNIQTISQPDKSGSTLHQHKNDQSASTNCTSTTKEHSHHAESKKGRAAKAKKEE